jgi:hypothetical protein
VSSWSSASSGSCQKSRAAARTESDRRVAIPRITRSRAAWKASGWSSSSAWQTPLPTGGGRDRGPRLLPPRQDANQVSSARHGQRVHGNGEGQYRAGPASARTIRVHYSPPSRRTPRARPVVSREAARTPDPRPGWDSLAIALALHGLAQSSGRLRSHLASPLMPGKGVPTRRGLSTGGISGPCPWGRLAERGAA